MIKYFYRQSSAFGLDVDIWNSDRLPWAAAGWIPLESRRWWWWWWRLMIPLTLIGWQDWPRWREVEGGARYRAWKTRELRWNAIKDEGASLSYWTDVISWGEQLMCPMIASARRWWACIRESVERLNWTFAAASLKEDLLSKITADWRSNEGTCVTNPSQLINESTALKGECKGWFASQVKHLARLIQSPGRLCSAPQEEY